VYWQDGVNGATNVQRTFSTSALGTYSATAAIAGAGGGTEATTPEVRVVPTVSLTPTYISVPWRYDEYVTITATVQPEHAAAVVWSGAGWTSTESTLLRHVPRWDVPGSYSVFANVGEDTEQQEAVVQIQEPILRLVLDEDGNFNPASPSDDSATFLPGAYHGTVSRLVSEIAGPPGQTEPSGQIAHLIAYLVDPLNPTQVLTPPPGAQVTFSLENTSAWRGYAMNARWGDPRDDEPDYGLVQVDEAGLPVGAEGSSFPVAFGAEQPYARIGLRVKDFGGRTTVRAQWGTVPADPLALPHDNPNNWLPDAGWQAPFTSPTTSVVVPVGDDGGDAWTDVDEGDTPAASGPPDVGLRGDGLTRFEEYRGFVVNGVHTRTSPLHKDLFVASLVDRQPSLSLAQGLEFTKGSLFEHGIRLHHILHPEQAGAAESSGPLVNYSYLLGGQSPADTITGYRRFVQLALHVGFGELMGLLGLTTGGGGCVTQGYTPNEAPSITVDIDRHVTRGSSNPTLTTAQIDNEIRRTIGHEIGHGIHVKHKNDTNPTGCDDGAPTLGTSLMTSGWFNGAGAGNDASRYNDADVRQMRLHHHTQP
jgi:hypothetical protein